MAKLDIDFVLLDESVVMHGFRALMSGAKLEGFIANPVLLVQHNRPSEHAAKDEIMLPIGMWYDIRIEDGRLLAKPDFDDDDELAMKVQGKVQKGYLKGASVWIEPMAISDSPEHMLAGQSLPTFTEWGLLESSIVDIPNCRNALAVKASNSSKRILLNAEAGDEDLNTYINSITNNNKMTKQQICAKLGLDENISDAELGKKLSAMQKTAEANEAATAENKNPAITINNAMNTEIETCSISLK